MRIAALFISLVILLFPSCNDGSWGVLQYAHNASEEDSSKNSAYLGVDGNSLIIIREGDVMRASDSAEGDGSIVYSKILELSSPGATVVDFPFMACDGYLYMASKDVDTGVYSFYRLRIPSSGQIDLDTAARTAVTIEGEAISGDNVLEFNASCITPGKVQILYKVRGETGENRSHNRHYGVIEWSGSTTLTLVDQAEVPTNSIIIGDGILKCTTDDPELDYVDDMNDLYIYRNGTMHKVYTGTTYYNFPMGSDKSYAILANGELYAIDYTYSERGYTAALTRHSAFTFDPYKREGNYMVTYQNGNSIIGFISENGIYWREDITDTSASSSNLSIPRLKTINEDNDIIPLSFIGAASSEEYLLLTQNNGFYVLQPNGGTSGRGAMQKLRAGSAYRLADFI